MKMFSEEFVFFEFLFVIVERGYIFQDLQQQ